MESAEEAKGLLFFGTPEEKDSKEQIAICRRHIAVTSAKTDRYLNFCPSHAGAKIQMSPFHDVPQGSGKSAV
jgi:hypothetical protein